jgi:23S rRNA pseudouridine2605 synthase
LPTTEFNDAQLSAARAKMWHQDGEALLTLEAARTWVKQMGLVLFAPRPQIAAPAASLVEATLGKANSAPTLVETEVARGFVARMVQEGDALPLHLLGEAGDAPDFVVSAQMFSFVFTLRGDKAWKLPPATTGLSPLGTKVYEALTAKGALSAMELASELGREVTEAAILRALVELWSQLRVIPLLQLGQGTTLWELTTARFTKAIKAGANAGQPTALSALISLYLTQAVAATEEETETYLSPLTARSRVREVVHALTAGRQFEAVVLEGKTLLHVPGSLPEFAPAAVEEIFAGVDGEAVVVTEKPKKIGTGRIGKFAPGNKAVDELRGKPVKKFGGSKPEGRKFGAGPGMAKPSARFGARADGKSDSERRPFKKDSKPGFKKPGFAKPGFGKPGFSKPSFTKPWEEGRKPRAAGSGEGDAFKKFRKPGIEERKPLGDREQAGLPATERVFSKPKFERESFARDAARHGAGASEGGAGAAWKKPRSFEKKPFAKKPYEKKPFGKKPEGFAAKRPYKPRDAEGGEKREFKPRSFEKKPYEKKPFAKRPFGDKPGGFAAKRPYKSRDAESGEKREFKPRSFEKKPYEKKPFEKRPGGFGAKKPFTPRTTAAGEGTFAKRPYKPRDAEAGATRGDFKPRSFEKKPFEKKPGNFGSKPRFGGGKKTGGFGSRRGFTPVDENAERVLPKRPYKPRAADADQRKFTKAPWTPAEDAGAGTKRKSLSGGKKFGGKKFGAKKFSNKPARKREE